MSILQLQDAQPELCKQRIACRRIAFTRHGQSGNQEKYPEQQTHSHPDRTFTDQQPDTKTETETETETEAGGRVGKLIAICMLWNFCVAN